MKKFSSGVSKLVGRVLGGGNSKPPSATGGGGGSGSNSNKDGSDGMSVSDHSEHRSSRPVPPQAGGGAEFEGGYLVEPKDPSNSNSMMTVDMLPPGPVAVGGGVAGGRGENTSRKRMAIVNNPDGEWITGPTLVCLVVRPGEGFNVVFTKILAVVPTATPAKSWGVRFSPLDEKFFPVTRKKYVLS